MSSSNLDMLRLELPQTLSNALVSIPQASETVEVRNPAAWLRLMNHQYQTAQRDLRQLYQACDQKFNEEDSRMQEIRRNYEQLCDGVKYVYNLYAHNAEMNTEWLRTELSTVANATHALSSDVWAVIRERNQKDEDNRELQSVANARLQDAIVFLETAQVEQRREQAVYNRNVEIWAGKQEEKAEYLYKEQQRIKEKIARAEKKLKAVEVRTGKAKEKAPEWVNTTPRGGSRAERSATRETPAGAGMSPPPPPPRRPVTNLGGDPSDEEPSDDDDSIPLPRRSPPRHRNAPLPREDDEDEESRFARIIAAAVSASNPRAIKLKMKEPKPFDGKQRTSFRPWWDSVEEYLEFHPETNEQQKIAWVGSRLEGTAAEWHQARRKSLRQLHLEDTWQAYQEALKEAYRDTQEGANALRRMWALEYRGDIQAYMTSFRSLNMIARATGEPLQDIVNQAMTTDIVDMCFNQHTEPYEDDEDFLETVLRAGNHVERRDALKKARAMRKGGSGSQGSGGDRKGPGNGRQGQGKGRDPGGRKESGESPEGRKAKEATGVRKGRTREGDIYPGAKEALVGVPQKEIDAHKASKCDCWRCGRDGHRTFQCYARKTVAGTELPESPKVSSVTKRKRDTQDTEPTQPRSKQHKAAAVVVEDEAMTEAPPFWERNESEPEDF